MRGHTGAGLNAEFRAESRLDMYRLTERVGIEISTYLGWKCDQTKLGSRRGLERVGSHGTGRSFGVGRGVLRSA